MNRAQAKKAVLLSLMDHFTAVEDVIEKAMECHDDHVTDEEKAAEPQRYALLVRENERRIAEAAREVLRELERRTR